MALPKNLRLPLRVEEKNLREKGKHFYGKLFVAVLNKNDLSHLRVALIIGKKTAPQSVVRNKTKRLVFLTLLKSPDLLKRPFDFLIIAGKKLPFASSKEILLEITLCLNKIS